MVTAVLGPSACGEGGDADGSETSGPATAGTDTGATGGSTSGGTEGATSGHGSTTGDPGGTGDGTGGSTGEPGGDTGADTDGDPEPLRIFYVSVEGDDGNDGLTEDTPWRTLAHAEATATEPGDAIALRRGDVFLLDEALGIHHGGTEGVPILWDGGRWGEGPNAVIRVAGDREAPHLAAVNVAGCQDVTLRRLTIDADDHRAFGLVVGGTDSYYAPGSVQNDEARIAVRDSEILGCGDAGDDYVICVLFQTWNNDMADMEFSGNRVDGASNHAVSVYMGREEHGAVPSVLHGIVLADNHISNFGKNDDGRSSAISVVQEVEDAVIERNLVEQGAEGHGAAIVLAGNEQGSPSGVVVRHNDVRMVDDSAVSIQNGHAIGARVYANELHVADPTGGAAVWMQIASEVGYSGSELAFHNNTIVVDTGVAFMDDTSTVGVTTFSNNLLACGGTGQYEDPCFVSNVGASADHHHNLYVRPNEPDGVVAIENDGSYVMPADLAAWESTAVGADPQLLDLAGHDWRLAATSPARGAGVAEPGVDADAGGQAYENPPSLGAREYGP